MKSEREYNRAVGKILAGKALDPEEAQEFVAALSKMEAMLDEANADDYFGTEGWQYNMGWN